MKSGISCAVPEGNDNFYVDVALIIKSLEVWQEHQEGKMMLEDFFDRGLLTQNKGQFCREAKEWEQVSHTYVCDGNKKQGCCIDCKINVKVYFYTEFIVIIPKQGWLTFCYSVYFTSMRKSLRCFSKINPQPLADFLELKSRIIVTQCLQSYACSVIIVSV